MSALVAFAPCFSCGQSFTFNPDLVPSVTYENVKRPICKKCVESINPIRVEMGNPPIVPLPGAYDPEVQ